MKKMSKKRQAVWNKSGGLCWYCGCGLQKGWHVDHFEPVGRFLSNGKQADASEFYPELNELSNLVPSCPPCNNYKHSLPLEYFRKELQKSALVASRASTAFRRAEKFGLLEVKDVPIVFWFEKQGGWAK